MAKGKMNISQNTLIDLKPDRKPILQEIEALYKRIDELTKRIDDFENYTLWGFSFLKELQEVVGLGSLSAKKELARKKVTNEKVRVRI